MTRLLHHVRHNAVAYLALFVALGGSSYAALSLPKNSVGARQIRKHSITPSKFNPKFTAGTVRGWAEVQDGKIFDGGGRPQLVTNGEPSGRVGLTWRTAVSSNCAAFATVATQGLGAGAPSTAGYATASIVQVTTALGGERDDVQRSRTNDAAPISSRCHLLRLAR